MPLAVAKVLFPILKEGFDFLFPLDDFAAVVFEFDLTVTADVVQMRLGMGCAFGEASDLNHDFGCARSNALGLGAH